MYIYNLAKQSAINCEVVIVKLRIRLGLVKAGKLVFCYRVLRGKDEIEW